MAASTDSGIDRGQAIASGRTGREPKEIVPGHFNTQQEAYAVAAASPKDALGRDAHPGYDLDQLALRCWAVGVPVRGADHIPKRQQGRILRDDYHFMRDSRWRVHQLEHREPAENPTTCKGHKGQGAPCGATAVSLGDGFRRWRYDGGNVGPADADVPSLARARLARVRTYLLDRGQSEANIATTPSIAQIVKLLEALPDATPEHEEGSGRSRSQATPEYDSDEAGELEQAIRSGANPLRRRAVELRAMKEAKRHYREEGWRVRDVSATESFDLRCTRDGEELHVEVKGLSGGASEITLTRNEVAHARNHRTALFVLCNITVSRDKSGTLVASGGDCLVFKDPWELDDDDLTPARPLLPLARPSLNSGRAGRSSPR